MAHALLPIPGKGGSNFAYGLSVPVAGGLIGGAIAGLFIRQAF
jgi:glycerol uptake facilitator protein